MTNILRMIVIFLSAVAVPAEISFHHESVTVVLAACDTFEVRGVYYFANSDSTAAATAILYPFPVDSTMRLPDSVCVTELSTGKPVALVKRTDGVTWSQRVAGGGIDSVLVIYRQYAPFGKGRYILTTTRSWNRPLVQAVFSVVTRPDITLSYWSMQADSVTMEKGNMLYRAVRRQFMPAQDMLLEWECGKKE